MGSGLTVGECCTEDEELCVSRDESCHCDYQCHEIGDCCFDIDLFGCPVW